MKRYIITDPCYIMDNEQYDKFCDDWFDFNLQDFPLYSRHRKTGDRIVFHYIENTRNGDGSYEYNCSIVGVDSGMLCIAECDNGWHVEKFGARFDTLEDAKKAFSQIKKQF